MTFFIILLMIFIPATPSYSYDLDALLSEERETNPVDQHSLGERTEKTNDKIAEAHDEYDKRYNSKNTTQAMRTVFIDINCIGHICTPENFNIIDGPADIDMSAGTAFLSDIGQGVHGDYSYEVKLMPTEKYCAGKFILNNVKNNAILNVYESSCDAYVDEY